MKTLRVLSCFVTLAFMSLASDAGASPVLIVPAGSVWKYLADGTDPGAAWGDPTFNDATWPSGPAQLGFGDGDETTTLTPGIVTAYFRRVFEFQSSGVTSLNLRLLRDDGAIVYINGVEVFRNNMPPGPASYNTFATATVGGEEETTQFIAATLNPNVLVQGPNVIAVEVHQVNIASSDLSFDLELIAESGPSVPVINVVATDSDAAESGLLAAIFPGTFTFYRNPVTTNALTVSFTLSGTAENGVDYMRITNEVRFTSGQTRVDVIPLNDSLVEGTEIVVVTLQEPVCAAIVPPPPGCYRVGPSNRAEVLIRDANSPQNERPYVQLNEPQNGAEFTAPTNIVLRAFAQDKEDHYQISVEFLANGNSLGFGTFVATTCPTPYCPYYELLWPNPLPGNYTLIARAIDSSGASSNSAPVSVTVHPFEGEVNVPLITLGSVWKYLDNGTDQGTAWPEPAFNDSTWAAGLAQLGYGDGDEATTIAFGPDPANKYITTYFRRSFSVANASSFTALRGRLLQDDGGAVYLNGVEVFRSNLPSGPITYSTLAIIASPDNQIVEFSAPPSLLREGANVVAVEMHQNTPLSSDLSFDLELIAPGAPPPELPTVAVVATDSDAAESGALAAIFPGVFTFSRTGSTSNALTAFFILSGSAENGTDYRYVSNSVRFNPGQAQARVEIIPLNDLLVEGTENVVLTLQEPACIAIFPPPPGCYRVGTANHAEVFIKDANRPPTNTPPYVQINQPRNGDVFIAPTNITLLAFASDREDASQLSVEFFANGTSLGHGVFVPALCPAPFCPYYQLIWSNVPPGEYTIVASATDSSGNSSNSTPVNIAVRSHDIGTNVTLIALGSIWKYVDNGTDQGTAWRQPTFNDAGWTSGPAQLGYGDGDEATTVGFGPDPANKYITTYFRKSLNIVNAANVTQLRGRLLEDDGGVVYLNGVEIFRSNLPGGPINFDTLATLASPDNQIVEFSTSTSLLREGVNIVAVEMHQNSPASSDLSFDLELVGDRPNSPTNNPPRVQINEPQTAAVFDAPATITFHAYAQDPEDSYNVSVEYFAGDRSLGMGTFVPTRCAAPFCPYFELTWSDVPAGRYSIRARATDQSGASAFSEPIQITVRSSEPQPAPRDQQMPAIASNNELYFVVWVDQRDFNDFEWDIYGARVTREGRVLDPNGIRICAQPGIQWYPSVASDGRDFFVVWNDGRDGLADDIYGARVTADGTVLNPNGFLISGARSAQFGPSVAFNGTEYLAAWYDYRNSDDARIRNDIYGARISRDGVVLDPQGIAICTAEDMQWAPGVAALGDNFFVAWSDSRLNQVRGTGISGSGTVFNPDGLMLAPYFSGYFIRVAANASGFLSVWTDARNYETTQYDIFARRADASGQLIGDSDFALCRFNGMQTAPCVAAGREQFLAVWLDTRAGENNTAVFGSRIGTNGVLDLNGFVIGEHAYGYPLTGPAVGSLNGEYLVAWVAGNNETYGPTDIVAARVGANGAVLDREPFLVSSVTVPNSDADHDGVLDARDQCPNTPAGAIVDSHGCTIAQLCRCEDNWRSHSEYVQCAIQHAWEFFRAGLITADARREIIRNAVVSNCGRRPDRAEPACIHLFPLTYDECRRDGVQFVISGDASGSCMIECSTDLVNWSAVPNSAIGVNGVEISCPMEPGSKARFYRVRAAISSP